MKLRVGILFGGNSREREISFAGGRTVYDNLNKALFEPVPIFIDSFLQFIVLDWQYIYKGSIRDFYPPVQHQQERDNAFQLYAENLLPRSAGQKIKMAEAVGRPIQASELSELIDVAFLCLHGCNGEDGRIQGLLEYYNIPYTGSGILPSALGMNKAIQKQWMQHFDFKVPRFSTVKRDDFLNGIDSQELLTKLKQQIGQKWVVKPANQGSSIGVSILENPDKQQLHQSLEKAFFINNLSINEKLQKVKQWADIREGLGLPLQLVLPSVELNKLGPDSNESIIIYHPVELAEQLDNLLKNYKQVQMRAIDEENEVIIEAFIQGREFSCIAIRDENGKAIALPPTEIKKSTTFYDYRSKYLPGLSRKITPIDLPESQLKAIQQACEKLMVDFQFDAYARIDGFIAENGDIFLNDPNTTSGMMPSSFFFHQAAEVGFNPSQFITFILRSSLAHASQSMGNRYAVRELLHRLDNAISMDRQNQGDKIRVAVLFGGYSSERHIAVESGRNIYEKLSSSDRYQPIPVFLTGSANKHLLYQVPINILLKDNADDIAEKINHFLVHPVVVETTLKLKSLLEKYTNQHNLKPPVALSYEDLAKMADAVFIALHGRPGEDGSVQTRLDALKMPYNGSGAASSQLTIDKFQTNEILAKQGFLVAKHQLVQKANWQTNAEQEMLLLEKEFAYPFIAKPVDDGCSSAVRKIKSRNELEAFAKLIFRQEAVLDQAAANVLNVHPNEEFPIKSVFLVEELIDRKGAEHFLEITGGLLTTHANNQESPHINYSAFEASEALAEGEILSLEEKFLAGQGQNITPARYNTDPAIRQQISNQVKAELCKAAELLGVEGYARIDCFVRIYADHKVEVVFIEVNSLPGMTPATCIFHQSAIYGYKPYEFIDHILQYALNKK